LVVSSASAKSLAQQVSFKTRLKAHLAIARFDHVVKNVFILPGLLLPLSVDSSLATPDLPLKIALGLIAATLVACSNYVVNEVLDAPFDRLHPTKYKRPVAAGLVNIPLAYVQWIVMMLIGIGVGLLVSTPFAITAGVLWIMGCVYNIPPIRSKDRPYVDVLSESVNNPLRMMLGWYMVTPSVLPPLSILTSYWMVGCYFMAIKRISEYRDINDPQRAAAYRKSFAHYTEARLLVSIMFYAATAMLFFGAFIVRYRMELVLSFPLVALVMAVYLHLSYCPDSAVQNPEKLHRSKKLMLSVTVCAVAMIALLWIDIPVLSTFFTPTMPTTNVQK
jgi:4-hydroxybenzoate polyprenyltransferase